MWFFSISESESELLPTKQDFFLTKQRAWPVMFFERTVWSLVRGCSCPYLEGGFWMAKPFKIQRYCAHELEKYEFRMSLAYFLEAEDEGQGIVTSG